MAIKIDDAYWYRYISFDPLRVGSARLVKNTVYGIGVDPESADFYIWFSNSNERVRITYDDVKALHEGSRPFAGKVKQTPVMSGIPPKSLLAAQGYAKADLPESRRPSNSGRIKEKDATPTVEDDARNNAQKEPERKDPTDQINANRLKKAPYVYGMSLRPYGMGTTPPHFTVVTVYSKQEVKAGFPDAKPESYRHGAVGYATMLSKKLADNFDMIPLNHTFAEDVTDSVEDTLDVPDGYYRTIVDETAQTIANKERSENGSFKLNEVNGVIQKLTKRKSLLLVYMKEHTHMLQRISEPVRYRNFTKVLSRLDLKDLDEALIKYTDERSDGVQQTDSDMLMEYLCDSIRKEEGIRLTTERVRDLMDSFVERPRSMLVYFVERDEVKNKGDDIDAYIDFRDRVRELDLDELRLRLNSIVDAYSDSVPAVPETEYEDVMNHWVNAIVMKWGDELTVELIDHLMKRFVETYRRRRYFYDRPEYDDSDAYDHLITVIDSLSLVELRKRLMEHLNGSKEEPTADLEEEYTAELTSYMVDEILGIEGDDIMEINRITEIMDRLHKRVGARMSFFRKHPTYVETRGVDDDLYYEFEDAVAKINLDEVKKRLIAKAVLMTDAKDAEVPEVEPEFEYQKQREGQMVNNPKDNLVLSPHKIVFTALKSPVMTGVGTCYPCTDPEIIEMMNRIQDHMGNRVKMNLDYLEWGIAPATAMVTYGNKAKQLLLISPDQLRRLYGRLDFAILGSAVTHEMGHYCLNQIVKNSDKMKFKRQVAGIRLHSSQLTSSGSTYPFFHEQFAMLCEYGVWGTCVRGLQTTKGWEIVNKYFDLTQHIDESLAEQYP